MLKWLLKEESGQGMVEYGLILALVAVVVIGVLSTIGKNLDGRFDEIADKLKKDDSGSGSGTGNK